jgi:hypothetical protein
MKASQFTRRNFIKTTALKSLGCGKLAAYEALSADGQFSVWLQFAPDGMISWKY